MSISKTIWNGIQEDTVKVPIKYIRIANQVFVERDKLDEEVETYKKLNSINATIIDNCDTVVNKLEDKINNLNLIISTKEGLHNNEIDKLNQDLKKSRRANYLLGGSSAIFIILLIVL